jgi:8-oxo-dGTP pyrophosphatase MutT (NUDIX family)
VKLLDKIECGLGALPNTAPLVSTVAEAAVLVAITSGADPELLLTRRAAHLTSHGYQVAFPGGKWEAGDADLVATALRESREEVNLDPLMVNIKGALPRRQSRWGVDVSPFVGIVPEGISLSPNPAEIDCIFMVPLRHFLTVSPVRIDHVERQNMRLEVPVWQHQGFEIWGLTALIIQDLLKVLEAN